MSEAIVQPTNIDANSRLNPILSKTSFLQDEKVQRVIDVALPFLCLYQPAALATNLTLGSIKTYQIVSKLPKDFKESKQKGFQQLAILAFTVTTVALSILAPAISVAISQTYSIAMQIERLRQGILKHNTNEILEATANIAISAIYIASVVTAAPEVIAISMIAQGAFELYEAYREFQHGRVRFLEGVAKVIMGLFRLSQAAPIVKDLHRNYFGKKVTQMDMDEIFQEMMRQQLEASQEQTDIISSGFNARGTVTESLNDFLQKKHLSGDISNINFNGREFEKMSFKKIRFFNCNFDSVFAKECKFESTFKNCSMVDFTAIQSKFSNGSIMDSILTRAVFYNCEFSNFQFYNCDLTKVCFNESVLKNFLIDFSTLLETNFFGVTVSAKSKIANSDLTDTLLCNSTKAFKFENCTENKFTRPVVSLLWNFETPMTYALVGNKVLERQGAIVLKADFQPRDINVKKLNSEVNACLKEINKMPENSYTSIAQELVKKAPTRTEMAKIYAKAKELMDHADGAYMPGGTDVNPVYYGAKQLLTTLTDPDHRHGLYEFCLYNQIITQKKPAVAICRGAQIYNIYQGGTLKQSLKGHKGGVIHDLQVNPDLPQHIQHIVTEIVGEGVMQGKSLHHQGCSKIGKGIHVAMRAEDKVPELLISDDGLIMASQFHPEVHVLNEIEAVDQPGIAKGKNIFNRFMRQMKKTAVAA